MEKRLKPIKALFAKAKGGGSSSSQKGSVKQPSSSKRDEDAPAESLPESSNVEVADRTSKDLFYILSLICPRSGIKSRINSRLKSSGRAESGCCRIQKELCSILREEPKIHQS